MKYDYYSVSVPGDAADSIKDLAHLAINEAKERSRVYALPATWTAQHLTGCVGDWQVHFRVRRERSR